jgi:hypothetical protein
MKVRFYGEKMKQTKDVYILYNKVEKEFLGWDEGLVEDMLDAKYFDGMDLINRESMTLDEPENFEIWEIEITYRTK